eukprot:575708-Pelagomonas_calceolata.AAC.6
MEVFHAARGGFEELRMGGAVFKASLGFVPGVAQGLGPESRQNACQDGVLRKLSPGLPDQQRWLGTLLGAHFGESGGLGRGPENCSTDLNYGREMARSQGSAMGLWIGEPMC